MVIDRTMRVDVGHGDEVRHRARAVTVHLVITAAGGGEAVGRMQHGMRREHVARAIVRARMFHGERENVVEAALVHDVLQRARHGVGSRHVRRARAVPRLHVFKHGVLVLELAKILDGPGGPR